ncbi:MAG: precorrin-2 C(20)-methyltransferase [Nitrospirae bacterium]|nr:precorrin-2 C(20)-methyltransferase [Nitrospirota bacterium]
MLNRFNKMPATLYVIGAGPGDPELLTIKAARILQKIPCICVPKGRDEGNSLALSIIKEAVNLDGKEIIEAVFPMVWPMVKSEEALRSGSNYRDSLRASELNAKWDNIADAILSRLNKGIDVAFVTIGDPTIYSTYFYLHDRLLRLMPDLRIKIIPGVSSINASSAAAIMSLAIANERIAILPSNYLKEIKKTLSDFDTIVLMKVYKVFNEISEALKEAGLLDRAVYISNVGSKEEKIFRDIRMVREDDLNYFSMIIVKK